MTSKIKFEYQYRDGANYKRFADLFFENPLRRSAVEIESTIQSTLIDKSWFIADQIGIPQLFLFLDGIVTDNDHCLHEFIGVESMLRESSDDAHDSIENLLESFKKSSETGWKQFDPLERSSSTR
ncbi:hypothetical protein N9Y42_05435 [Mariniblastus sp.]|nr:hypothetical protein [Mariniblastus sp.]